MGYFIFVRVSFTPHYYQQALQMTSILFQNPNIPYPKLEEVILIYGDYS